jgi:hypothetical protein
MLGSTEINSRPHPAAAEIALTDSIRLRRTTIRAAVWQYRPAPAAHARPAAGSHSSGRARQRTQGCCNRRGFTGMVAREPSLTRFEPGLEHVRGDEVADRDHGKFS